MIFFLGKDRISYFQSYKRYFQAIYLVFLGFPVGDLIHIAYLEPTLLRLGTQLLVTSGTSIAVIWGYVATRLYLYPEPFSFRRLLSRPIRFVYLAYLVYLIPMFLASVLAWADPSQISTGSSFQVTYLLEGLTQPSASVGSFLLELGAVVVIVFTLYPFAIISRRRALVKDRDVRSALRIIAGVFGVISATLILGIAISSFGYGISGSTNFVSVILIIVAVQAFRKPSFLKSFLGVVPSLESSPTASHYDQMILIHSPSDDKFGPISKYIVDGVNRRYRVFYFHRDDETVIREGLSRQGIDVTRYTLKGLLRLQSLGSIYPNKGVVDDTPIELIRELLLEARTLGNEGIIVILDYDNFVVRPFHRFVQHLTDPRWTNPDHSLHMLMAFDSTAFRGEEASLAELEKKIRTLDMSESTNVFSQTVGLSHEAILGKKLLLEFDPQSDFERIFRSLLAESASNFERTVAFTRRESHVHMLVQRQPGAKIFVLTSRVSYPKMENENLVLLPSYDTSLLLDALNKTIEAYAGSSFTIIFDSISHFVFTIGPERTYSLVRQALELMISNRITAIFLMNSKAHEQKVASTFENMFDLEIVFELGMRVPEVRRQLSVSS
jgi:hypothetical protein